MTNVTFAQNSTTGNSEPFKWQAIYLLYATVMFLVLTVGFLGNVISFIILRYREHRRKVVTPLMINLAVADILIIVLVYPVMVATNLLRKPLRAGSLSCMWSSFGNGVIGLTSVATLVAMSGVMYHVIKQTMPHPKFNPRRMKLLVAGTWLYGILLNLPPLIGWSRVVPGKAGFSCAPDWTSSDPWAIAYVVFLIVFGFFIPLIMIGTFHFLIYRLIGHAPLPGNVNIMAQASRRKSQMKLVRMTAMSIAAFLMSWLPFTSVSLAAIINGRHVISTGEAEIPELMAKASVIYNPVVYTFMNGAYRASLWGMISGTKVLRVNPYLANTSARRCSSLNSAAINQSYEETAL